MHYLEMEDTMNRVVQILMERDKITQQEAEDLVAEVRELMEDCEYDPVECEDIFMSNLGLELDYIVDII